MAKPQPKMLTAKHVFDLVIFSKDKKVRLAFNDENRWVAQAVETDKLLGKRKNIRSLIEAINNPEPPKPVKLPAKGEK